MSNEELVKKIIAMSNGGITKAEAIEMVKNARKDNINDA